MSRQNVATGLQSPSPGFGEKNFSNLPGIPSNSLWSAGGSRLAVMFGHWEANSLLTFEPFLEARLGVRLDRVDRAFRLADAAVDALVRVDDEHVLAFVEAVDGTDLDAVHEFAADAVVVDDVGQGSESREVGEKLPFRYPVRTAGRKASGASSRSERGSKFPV